MAKRSPSRWNCVDCGYNTSLEHYFVHNEVWYGVAGMPESGMLCIGCLEARIGRTLTPSDFPKVHINNPKTHPMTLRLVSRIEGKK